ncbi:sensor histidine kinase [Thermaerobacillus caldiproteolyticus]|uniref:sensor histidine kinase n=1 Tax=Thermaerobacillus caldiproteolyticus TaxID=247480 RepID=UPI00188CABAA|nr:HAMP domain-containing sensor histidine kinase [Anoxybacillus caldiproteolyticus]QPA30028.1 two-component sensor histidine kinase [Anoxybacillus caldiproteolyticus]
MKKFTILRAIIFRFSAALISLVLCWTAAFFITNFLYAQLGYQPSDYLRELVNFILGLSILGTAIRLIAKIARWREKQFEFFHSITETIEQIANGNFNVSLSVPDSVPDESPNFFRELIESINRMANELNEMEQMRQEFVSNVSHEIQSPLTSIIGFTHALKNEELDQEQRLHYLNIIEAESKRLSKLSDNLLKLTSLESNHHPYEPKKYRLDQQLKNIVLACEPQWLEKEMEIDISLDKTEITADKDLLDQVWMNLLHNSIKFTPKGGSISIRLEKNDQIVKVVISDTGIGMSEEEKMHIFERFYKADRSRNRSGGGSGLGLSIVKKIVSMHHGEIEVESAKGKGTTMIVSLPLGE